ncbi:MAG: hypothetical protein ABSD31_17015 [Candidatus Binataceae bacterium]|jgi:hypothetical protein
MKIEIPGSPNRMKRFSRLITGVVLIAAVGEIIVQLSGIVDVPIYEANNQTGYIPAPNQHGAFLRMHTWRFNEYSMEAGPFDPKPSVFNLLLVGDSIVCGGNPLNEPDRLGPQLEALTHWQVWPICAGSWALQNELTYLQLHPRVLEKVDAVAIVSNSGDFDEPSSWASEITHPMHRPFPGLLYVIRKYALTSAAPPVSPALKVARKDWQLDLHAFASSFHKSIFIFMYPDVEEVHDSRKLQKDLYGVIPNMFRQVAGAAARIYKVADSGEWNDKLYRDEIHPTSKGNSVLARIIKADICETANPKMACER